MSSILAEREQMGRAMLIQATSATEVKQVERRDYLRAPGEDLHYFHAGIDLYTDRMPV